MVVRRLAVKNVVFLESLGAAELQFAKLTNQKPQVFCRAMVFRPVMPVDMRRGDQQQPQKPVHPQS
jgi:hypothetical protein